MELFFVPSILFILVVCPLWLALHYQKIYKSQRMLTEEEHLELESLRELAELMAERIEALESILDLRAGSWQKSPAREAEGARDEQP